MIGGRGQAEARSLPPSGDKSPKRPKMGSPGTIVPARAEQLTEESTSKMEDSTGAIVPARAEQLNEEISRKKEELAALIRAQSLEGSVIFESVSGSQAPGKYLLVSKNTLTNILPPSYL